MKVGTEEVYQGGGIVHDFSFNFFLIKIYYGDNG